MSDEGEKILRAIGASIRKTEGLSDPRWEKLARGELPAEEHAELRALPPPEGAEASLYELLRPPGDADAEESRKKTAALWAKHAASRRGAGAVTPIRQASERAQGAARARRPGWAMLLAAAFAGVLGAAGMWVALRPPLAAMPAYALALQGGAATTLGERDAGADVVRLDRAMRVALRLSPAAQVQGSVKARAWLARENDARPWKIALALHPDGGLSAEGPVDELFRDVPPGSWEIVVVVGFSEVMPDDAALEAGIARGERRFGQGTSVAVQRILLEERYGSNAPERPAPRIELGGCAAFHAPRVCAYKPGATLRVWLGTQYEDNVTLEVDGRALALSGTDVQGGTAFDVPVPDSARSLTVRVLGEGSARQQEVVWTLAPYAPPAALVEVDALRGRGELDAAEAKIATAGAQASPELRAAFARSRARIALQRGRLDAAEALFEQTIAAARADGRASDEVGDRLALSNAQIYAGRWVAAESTLAGLEGSADPEAPAKAALYWGELAYERVDLRGALRWFRQAEEGAARLALTSRRREALHLRGVVLAELGRAEDADAHFAREEALGGPEEPPCERARRANNRGWIAIRRAPAGEAAERKARAIALLERAAGEDLSGCPSLRAEVLTSLSFGELGRGQPAAARAALKRAQNAVSGDDPRLARWWRRLEAEIALRERSAHAALSAFDALAGEALRDDLPDLGVESALGRAEALDALSRTGDARAAYAAADRALSAWTRRVPLGDGRDSFVGLHERVGEARVDFLVRAARRSRERGGEALVREAADAARQSLARYAIAIGRMDRGGVMTPAASEAFAAYRRERGRLDDRGTPVREEERAQLAALMNRAIEAVGAPDVAAEGDVPPLADGEIALVAHRTPGAWALFAVPARGPVEAATVDGALADVDLGGASVARFARTVADARRVRLPAAGPLASARPDLARNATVTYGLDLPGNASATTPAQGNVAVVAIDPERDAQATREAGPALVGALKQIGFAVRALWHEHVTPEALAAALASPEAVLFHYGGHAVQAGPDGIGASLRLAQGRELSAADILALPRVPPLVVLLGCETGRASRATGGLGLAQAFVLRGARAVVASDRPLLDATAAGMGAALYAQRGRGPSLDLPEMLHRAQIAMTASLPEDELWTLRALVP